MGPPETYFELCKFSHHFHDSTVRPHYNALLYNANFDITWLGLGSTTSTYSIIAWMTITESAIFEASQENWDSFIDYVCLRGISVNYFEVSHVFVCCVNEKVVGR